MKDRFDRSAGRGQRTAEIAQWSLLAGLVRRRLLEVSSVTPYIEHLAGGHGLEIAAILYYGSCLFNETQTESSVPDFYVLVSDPRRYHSSLWHAMLNAILPPNVYHCVFPSADGLKKLHCKSCVITMEQFRRETSPRSHDIHHLGRFSKRFALVYSRDEQTTRAVVGGALSAMLTLVPHSLARLPDSFSLEEFLLQQLGLSYLGEHRVVEPSKVRSLMDAGRDYYWEIYPEILQLYALRHGTPDLVGNEAYHQRGGDRARQRRRTQTFLARSRRRGVLRWPKYMFTVDNWLQYILDKLERHQGIKVELTPLQKRFPLLFGWPIYLRLRRQGVVR